MKIFGYITLLILAGSFTFNGQFVHPAQAKEICRQFVVAPKTFGKLKLVKYKQFENKKSGVQVRYAAKNHSVSIYKYDLGLARITEANLKKQLAGSSRAVLTFAERRKDKVLQKARAFAWKAGDVVFHGAVLQVTRKKQGKNAFEFIAMSQNTVCFLKLRYTDLSKTTLSDSLLRFKSITKRAQRLYE